MDLDASRRSDGGSGDRCVSDLSMSLTQHWTPRFLSYKRVYEPSTAEDTSVTKVERILEVDIHGFKSDAKHKVRDTR